MEHHGARNGANFSRLCIERLIENLRGKCESRIPRIAFSTDLPSYGGHLSAGVTLILITLILITHILFIPVETEAHSMSQIINIFSSLPLQVWGNGGQPWNIQNLDRFASFLRGNFWSYCQECDERAYLGTPLWSNDQDALGNGGGVGGSLS